MNRRTPWIQWSAALLSIALLEGSAAAQDAVHKESGFAINRYNPAERGSEWFALDSLDMRGTVRWAAGATMDWAYQPLVVYEQDGSTVGPFITNQAYLHLGASVVLLDRVRLGLNLPVAFYQSGETVAIPGYSFKAPSQSAMGDIRLSGDVRLFGEYGDALTGALGVALFLPTGSQDLYTGDGEVRVLPRFSLAGQVGMFAYGANVGFEYRGVDSDFGGNANGSEVRFGASAGVKLLDNKLLLGPEFFGSAVVAGSTLPKAAPPVEILLGAHYKAGDLRFGAGAGPGLTRGLGEPSARFLLSIEYTPGVGPCPDRDLDKVCDVDDDCPTLPGPASNFGCPEGCKADGDGDGVCDEEDACPDTFGKPNADPTKNGCPDDKTDTDQDGITDDVDACPQKPGFENADPKKHGCPLILDPDVLFRFDKDVIDPTPTSEAILQEVARLMRLHPEYVKFHVQAHTDAKGSDEYNMALSKRRAASVVTWFVAHGLSQDMFLSEGFGEMRPIAPNDTDEGRRLNRRVEIHVETVDPSLRPPKPPKEGIIEGQNRK